jgi:hypothetical protein
VLRFVSAISAGQNSPINTEYGQDPGMFICVGEIVWEDRLHEPIGHRRDSMGDFPRAPVLHA